MLLALPGGRPARPELAPGAPVRQARPGPKTHGRTTFGPGGARMKEVTGAVAARLARSLEAATGEGYRLGYEIARDEAAFLALEAGRPDIAERIRALRPLPDKRGPQG